MRDLSGLLLIRVDLTRLERRYIGEREREKGGGWLSAY